MCGICGIIDYKGSVSAGALLHEMAVKMKLRGPDDEGLYVDSNSLPSVGLGHRRLSIIDLSKSGHQPMPNEDGSIWLVCNGEIYNYKELRPRLEREGHTFRSNTDVETIIHLYESHGDECVKYLNGMFAFALYDQKERSILLARDRAGKKPLFYYHDSDKFLFASELSSLLADKTARPEVNTQAIHYYLSFGYVPAPLTIYSNVLKLLPGHTLTLRDGKLDLKRYWNLEFSPKLKISEDDAAAELLRLLEDAVKIRLYSDVPLGAFLSGGVDSSIVVALMSRLSARKVKTFSIGFQEQDYDELRYARNIATRYGTEHNEFIVKPDAIKILPLLIERYGEPYADSSCIPTYYVSRQTKQYVTVALNGDGGDELFGGYERYQAMLAAEVYQNCPRLFTGLINSALRLVPEPIDPKSKIRRLKRFFEAAALPATQRYLRWVSVFDGKMKSGIYSDDFKKTSFLDGPLSYLSRYADGFDGIDFADRFLMIDINTYLPNDLLVKVDVASMANSLEARSPFLDYRLMEFAAKLPSRYKLTMFSKKRILKRMAKGLVPAENLYRKKMGFGVPIGKWFRNELKELLCDTLLSDASFKRGYFNPAAVRGMVEGHIAGKKDYAFQLWALLMLELWHRKFKA